MPLTVESTLPTLLPAGPAMDRLVDMVLATCHSPHTRRMYGVQLRKFFTSRQPLTREGVALYLQAERDAGKRTDQARCAIRKLVEEAYMRNLLPVSDYHQIMAVKADRAYRTRAGQWLTIDQVEQFLGLPDRTDYYGIRDACILSCMLGCGFRRAEMASLTWDHYQEREGRMCFVDVVGKGGRRRTVPVPVWAKPDVERWKRTVAHAQRPPMYTMHRVGRKDQPPVWEAHSTALLLGRREDPHKIADGLTADGVWKLVRRYAKKMRIELAPHDLRRTLAQLMHKAGAPLEQIQYMLGHEDISTTMIYLGSKLVLGLGEASVDTIALSADSWEPMYGPQVEPKGRGRRPLVDKGGLEAGNA